MPYNCFQIKFWVVRGSIPCPGSETVRYGGNTFKIYGFPSPNGATLKQRLDDQMSHPNFPVPLQIMEAD
jgi:phosphoribosyl 1,2-cyclic phosphodiesterase